MQLADVEHVRARLIEEAWSSGATGLPTRAWLVEIADLPERSRAAVVEVVARRARYLLGTRWPGHAWGTYAGIDEFGRSLKEACNRQRLGHNPWTSNGRYEPQAVYLTRAGTGGDWPRPDRDDPEGRAVYEGLVDLVMAVSVPATAWIVRGAGEAHRFFADGIDLKGHPGRKFRDAVFKNRNARDLRDQFFGLGSEASPLEVLFGSPFDLDATARIFLGEVKRYIGSRLGPAGLVEGEALQRLQARVQGMSTGGQRPDSDENGDDVLVQFDGESGQSAEFVPLGVLRDDVITLTASLLFARQYVGEEMRTRYDWLDDVCDDVWMLMQENVHDIAVSRGLLTEEVPLRSLEVPREHVLNPRRLGEFIAIVLRSGDRRPTRESVPEDFEVLEVLSNGGGAHVREILPLLFPQGDFAGGIPAPTAGQRDRWWEFWSAAMAVLPVSRESRPPDSRGPHLGIAPRVGSGKVAADGSHWAPDAEETWCLTAPRGWMRALVRHVRGGHFDEFAIWDGSWQGRASRPAVSVDTTATSAAPQVAEKLVRTTPPESESEEAAWAALVEHLGPSMDVALRMAVNERALTGAQAQRLSPVLAEAFAGLRDFTERQSLIRRSIGSRAVELELEQMVRDAQERLRRAGKTVGRFRTPDAVRILQITVLLAVGDLKHDDNISRLVPGPNIARILDTMRDMRGGK